MYKQIIFSIICCVFIGMVAPAQTTVQSNIVWLDAKALGSVGDNIAAKPTGDLYCLDTLYLQKKWVTIKTSVAIVNRGSNENPSYYLQRNFDMTAKPGLGFTSATYQSTNTTLQYEIQIALLGKSRFKAKYLRSEPSTFKKTIGTNDVIPYPSSLICEMKNAVIPIASTVELLTVISCTPLEKTCFHCPSALSLDACLEMQRKGKKFNFSK